MKNKKYIFSIIPALIIGLFLGTHFCAAEADPPLVFSAINAGYKDDASSQNFDFIELKKTVADPLDLSDYKIVYYNSNDNEGGSLSFENLALVEDRLVLGYAKSPQYQELPEKYLYTFSSSGLASTAGRLVLMLGEDIADEICWGKTVCEKSLPKFATKAEDNNSALICDNDEDYCLEKYYPEPTGEALIELAETDSADEPEPEPEPEAPKVSCAGLRITEVLGYYNENSAEQFVEIFNPTAESISLEGCRLNYKKDYPLTGTIAANEYVAVWGILLTKNPTKDQQLALLDDDGIVDVVNYPHGQKKSASLARFEDEWRVTYAPTPAAENIYQEFRSCPEGKIINPETGNCKNLPVAKVAKTCEAGYYLNPATGRCKKNEVAATKECPEGYERNPETNRCRKVYKNTAQEYPVEPVKEGSYDNPRIFIAVGALVLLGVVAVAYIIWQFREELRKFIFVHFRRKRRAA